MRERERREREGLRIKVLLSALVHREACGGESGRLKLCDPGEAQRKLHKNPRESLLETMCISDVVNTSKA